MESRNQSRQKVPQNTVSSPGTASSYVIWPDDNEQLTKKKHPFLHSLKHEHSLCFFPRCKALSFIHLSVSLSHSRNTVHLTLNVLLMLDRLGGSIFPWDGLRATNILRERRTGCWSSLMFVVGSFPPPLVLKFLLPPLFCPLDRLHFLSPWFISMILF